MGDCKVISAERIENRGGFVCARKHKLGVGKPAFSVSRAVGFFRIGPSSRRSENFPVAKLRKPVLPSSTLPRLHPAPVAGRNAKGFTLIETMIVLALLGILVAMAVPSFSKMIERKRLGGAAEMVYEQLTYAKGQTIKRSKPIRVEFLADGSDTWQIGITDKANCNLTITDETDANACTIDYDNDSSTADPLLMRTTSLDTDGNSIYGKVKMATPSFAGGIPRTGFNPLRGTAAGGTVTLNSNKFNYQLQIRLTSVGRIIVCDPGTGVIGYPPCPS